MAVNDLGNKFSNEVYATREDVKKEMKINTIESIWGKVIEYRSYFNKLLTLKHITGNAYSICFTPIVSEKIGNIERRLSKAMISYSQLDSYSRKEIEVEELTNLLKNIALKYNLQCSDSEIKNIVELGHSEKTDLMVLENYLNAILEVKNTYFNEVNDEFFASMLQKLLHNDQLLEFYRTEELNARDSKFLVGKKYIGLPTNLIESSMNSLINFLRNSTISLFAKAACAMYYIYYIKPFSYYNEEIAVLLFKEVLQSEIGPVASLINVESLLVNEDALIKSIYETQNDLDLTYFVLHVLEAIKGKIDDLVDDFANMKHKAIVRETYSLDTEETRNENIEEMPALKVNPLENYSTSEEKPHEEKGASQQTQIVTKQPLTISVSGSLSEADARIYEVKLQEMDPNLKPSEASFYARHCTPEAKYTIRQFQKQIGCSYEKARYSMDELVFLGYYRKEAHKNKYVYIPSKKNND